ncbi:trans-Golgi network integral membrane protein 1 isoform X2 [Bicyclus anynana]|uniref:Trans-Golgi network integral membrane protein 1 isoform X2 n=1 Tax=Bicyclus anynana TaxID=110368 RepID=A0A6J1MFL2_BICAN|nr:trans-Golgi network integral membrane protein 1 isoform X2 [Bicyclus anynana]
MQIYIIALCFIIHGCHHGTGLPVVPSDQSPLLELANTCENSFLEDMIKQKVDVCKVNGTLTNPTALECYMFYDINTQLCAAFEHSEFSLQDNYKSKMTETQNVAAVCANSKSWKLVTIQPKSPYNLLIKVFSDPVKCQKLCGVGELFNDDTNYFCKYFKWGTEVIQNQQSVQETNLAAPDGAAQLSAVSSGKNADTVLPANNTTAPLTTANKEVQHVDTKLTQPAEHTKEASSEKSGQKTPTSTVNQSTSVEKAPESINSAKAEPSTAPVGVSSVKVEVEHPAAEEVPPKKDEVEKNGPVLEEPKDLLDVKGKPEEINPEDDENDNDDYDQHDELPADKTNIKNDNGGVESDPDVVFKGNNKPNLKIESITFPPQRDVYPNGLPDSFTDDDDHFFPIFLTGIILVVLLYILYHNKSKFTKVILGLIVEGRQSGRRRNSRGHAYRRLDTLEQAMSSTTAVPPSKIIY